MYVSGVHVYIWIHARRVVIMSELAQRTGYIYCVLEDHKCKIKIKHTLTLTLHPAYANTLYYLLYTWSRVSKLSAGHLSVSMCPSISIDSAPSLIKTHL